MKRISDQSYYELLDVPTDATQEMIDRAFAKAQAHLGPGSLATYTLADPKDSARVLTLIEDAYLSLSDHELRRAYNLRLAVDRGQVEPLPSKPGSVAPRKAPAEDEPSSQLAFDGVLATARVPTREPPASIEQAGPETPPAEGTGATSSSAAVPSGDEPARDASPESRRLPEADALVSANTGEAPGSLLPSSGPPVPEPGNAVDAEVGVLGTAPQPPPELVAAQPFEGAAAAAREAPPSFSPAPVEAEAVLDEPAQAVAGTATSPDPGLSKIRGERDSPPIVLETASTLRSLAPPRRTEAPREVGESRSLVVPGGHLKNAEAQADRPERSEAESRAPSTPALRTHARDERDVSSGVLEVTSRALPGGERDSGALAEATGRAERAEPSAELRREPSAPRMPDMGPGVVFNGEILRSVREARGLSLRELADRTRINHSHLENIEADRYGALPVAVYLRGFLMSVARELRLDPLKVSKSYLELVAKVRTME